MTKPQVHSRNPGNLPELRRRTFGRPRRIQTPNDLPLDWEDLFEEWGVQGLSITEARANLDMSYAVWSKWYRHWPEFREVVDRFSDLAEAFWLDLGKKNIGNKFFNSGLYMNCIGMRFKRARHIERYIEDTGNAEDTQAIEKAEDMRLADLFSGGDGDIEEPKRSPDPVPVADDAEWIDSVDFRTMPK